MKAERESLDYTESLAPTVRRWEVRFAMLGGGVAWVLHLIGVYLIAEFGCVAGLGHVHWLGVSVVSWMLIAATLLTGAMAADASWMAWRSERTLRGATARKAPVEPETKLFMATLAQRLNAVFAFIIAAQGVPILFFLRDC